MIAMHEKIDAENLLNIFTFCIIKSKCKNIIIHEAIICEFNSDNLLRYGQGAFLHDNFTIAIKFILEMSYDRNKGKEELRKVLLRAN